MITSEAVQRWVRVALYYVWGGLGTYGLTVGDSTKSLVASVLGFALTAAWTKYGSTVNAMLTEVQKVDGVQKVDVVVDSSKISAGDLNMTTPPGVTVKPV